MVETSHPGNIGAAARAMKNMGLRQLRLVEPRHFPHPDAEARASGAEDILQKAERYSQLAEAIADCDIVYGASARQRTLHWPQVTPRELAEEVSQRPLSKVALVLGRESSGLSNSELQLCQRLVTIPAAADFSSLNVAAAVQILAYELFLALAERELPPLSSPSAASRLVSSGEREGFYAQLQQTLIALDFLDPTNPRQLMPRLRRLFARIELEQRELNILRGILTAMGKRLQ
ncbi:RNA methyltransferase [Ectothiorhodospiraceae bacterium BW-2]|nr:RNA methyltransferase [Ectothiorhodospiraceae bacterium BW-2]